MTALSTESYKGVRDFFPEDYSVLDQVLGKVRQTAQSFGYAEYTASVLEPTELYRAKSSEEIVNEQTYSFFDRGGREVTLRPEMTPTIARMVASKRKELSFPVRWFSIPAVYRYEKPQRGRLREHYQINVDLLGAEGAAADAEIIFLAASMLKNLGAEDSHFDIRINSRAFLNAAFDETLKLSAEEKRKLFRLFDKANKISPIEFSDEVGVILNDESKKNMVVDYINTTSLEEAVKVFNIDSAICDELRNTLATLAAQGVTNAKFDPTLVRGFDYYTGIVFELYDTDPENPRALAGGGRYDGLVAAFGAEPVSAIGFGMGDVTLQDFLATHKLLPQAKRSADVVVCPTDGATETDASHIATIIRTSNIKVIANVEIKKIGDQLKRADKIGAKFVVIIGGNELASSTATVKELATGAQHTISFEHLPMWLAERI